MKKLIYCTLAASLFVMACSKDDKKCDSCTGASGTKYEICDNGDGTYSSRVGDETTTITEGELEGFTPKQVVELACEIDGELTF
ncbi:hypothetical protein GTQ34_07235 [Muricauda sp. JGD-17]|uniref:Lipoprotein n=1 Tax=Flagellimonas ochracea TaxID=2696472 RepID=A0A964WX56_9FLAO|nr:hypothetical protein [Allomuricauda ochracea]NAY91705.1 hypothetical protein [Allomuricauda ochracea]